MGTLHLILNLTVQAKHVLVQDSQTQNNSSPGCRRPRASARKKWGAGFRAAAPTTLPPRLCPLTLL